MQKMHYLEKELYELIKNDSSIFDFLQKGSLDGIWYWDLQNGENEWMSPKFWEVLGYDYKEKSHNPKEWQDIIFKEDYKKALENFHKHCENQEHDYDQIVRYKHKEGHTIWIRCRGIAIRDENGNPIRMLGAHNDITKEKETQEKLIDDSNLLKAILHSSLDGIMAFESVLDKNGEIIDFKIIMANKIACEIINLKEEEVINKKLSQLIPGNFKPIKSLENRTLFSLYKDVVNTGESKNLEFYFDYDGIKEWFENKVVKLNNGFVCTFSIITKQKIFQEELERRLNKEIMKQRKQEEMLIQQSKMAAMGEMIGAIAHNWRQPLNSISLLSNLIVYRYEDEELDKKYVTSWQKKIDKQLKFMSNTIDDFRNFFTSNENSKKIRLKNSIQKVVSLIQPQFDVHNIRISISFTETIRAITVENLLQQALINILSNAKDAIVENEVQNGLILINCKQDEQFIYIDIEDNGGGIKEEQILEKIFEPFFTTKKGNLGTGIGLYLTKMIIEDNLKGTICANNRENGLNFRIKLKK